MCRRRTRPRTAPSHRAGAAAARPVEAFGRRVCDRRRSTGEQEPPAPAYRPGTPRPPRRTDETEALRRPPATARRAHGRRGWLPSPPARRAADSCRCRAPDTNVTRPRPADAPARWSSSVANSRSRPKHDIACRAPVGRAQFVERGRLRTRERAVRELRERRTSPERERIVEGGDRSVVLAPIGQRPALHDQCTRRRRVGSEPLQRITRWARDDRGIPAALEVPPQPEHVVLQRLRRRTWRRPHPQCVDQPIFGDHRTGVQGEHGQQAALLRTAELYLATGPDHAHGPEEPNRRQHQENITIAHDRVQARRATARGPTRTVARCQTSFRDRKEAAGSSRGRHQACATRRDGSPPDFAEHETESAGRLLRTARCRSDRPLSPAERSP